MANDELADSIKREVNERLGTWTNAHRAWAMIQLHDMGFRYESALHDFFSSLKHVAEEAARADRLAARFREDGWTNQKANKI